VSDAPFWADDFDLDFPKVFPEAREMLGALGNVELVTTGRPDPRFHNLNHPAVWNGDTTMLAYFGFTGPARPSEMVAPGSALINCTAWQAFRDAWPHSYCMIVEGRSVWDTFALREQFDAILYAVRGLRRRPAEAEAARAAVMRSYRRAIDRFSELVGQLGDREEY
jgi:hypothetical protein